MRYKALLMCAFLLASLFVIVSTPVSAELDPEDYNLTKYDPEDDIIRVRTGGDFKNSNHPNVDILKMTSQHIENNELISSDDEIKLTMTVDGTIQNSESYKYAFALQVDGDVYVFAAYQLGQPVGIKLDEDNLLNPLHITATGAGTSTLTITFDLSLLDSHSSSYDFSGAAVYSVGDYERYIDMGPDKLVLITEPSDHSTLGGNVEIKGVIRESVDNKPGTNVQISIDGGTYESVTGTDPWSYDTNLNDGEHTIRVKVEGAGVDNAEDEITITVDSNTGSYESFDEKPSPNIGDYFKYLALDDAELNGIEIPLSTETEILIHDAKTITADGDDYEVYETWTNSTGGQDLGYVEFSNDVDKTTWRTRDGFATVKEHTYATNTATARDPTTTETTTTYTPPYDTRSDFSIQVGFQNKWFFDTTGSSESTTTVGSGQPTENPPYTEDFHYTGECLYYMSSMNVFGDTYNDIYVIRSYLENPGVSFVEYYSREIHIPIKIEIYDLSRNLLSSLGLNEIELKPFSVVIDDVTFDPEKPKADKENKINVKVKNIGTTDASNVEVTIEDGDRQVATETISSIIAGQSETQSITWKPRNEGVHTLTVTLSYQGDDITTKSYTIEVDPPPPDDGGISLILILLIIIIVVVVLVAVLLMKAKGKKEGEIPSSTPTPQETATALSETAPATEHIAATTPQQKMNQETIPCPSCKNGFTIQYESKPVKVKCPNCGMEGVLN